MLRQLSKLYLILILSGASLYALEVNNKESILKLGMEMSNMRNMLEAYILIGIKLKYKNPKQKLKHGISHYENLLSSLQRQYAKDMQMQKSINTSFKAWKIVKKAMLLALQNTDLEEMKKGAIFIHGHIRTVIKEMEHMKTYLLHQTSFKEIRALNASIEIAASARRLSAHYMMALWKLNDPTIKQHWNKGLKIYGDSLEILRKSPYMQNDHFAKLFNRCSKYYRYFTKMGHKPKIFSILIDKKANLAFQSAKQMTNIILQTK